MGQKRADMGQLEHEGGGVEAPYRTLPADSGVGSVKQATPPDGSAGGSEGVAGDPMGGSPDVGQGVDNDDSRTAPEGAGVADDVEGVAEDASLINLLHALTEEHGRVKAAERLGVDRKTLWRATRAGKLTPRLRDALEHELAASQRAETGELELRVAGLERRLQEVEQQLTGGLATVREELAGLREEVRAAGWSQPGLQESRAASTQHFSHRIYPDVVRVEELPDDEQVYGDAMPLVSEWREQRALFDAHWPQLEGLAGEVRMLELELELVEGRRLTLPPGEIPWEWSQRMTELRRRRERLETARSALRRARWRRWLVRLLTLRLPSLGRELK